MIENDRLSRAAPAAARTAPTSARDGGMMALCFMACALTVAEVNVIGRLFVSEAFLLLALPVALLVRGGSAIAPADRRVALFGCAWLVFAVASDWWNASVATDYLRGWFRISFLVTNFLSLTLLIERRQSRLRAAIAGLACGQLLGFYVNPPEFVTDYPWKFSLGPAATLLAALAACRLKERRHATLVIIFPLVAVASVSLLNGARGLAGVTFVAVILLMLQRPVAADSGRTRSSRAKVALMASVVILGGLAAQTLYGVAASQGLLGANEEAKYYVQSAADLPLLLAGRTEIFSSLAAIGDAPLLGHGSWPKDDKYIVIMEEVLARAGMNVQYDVRVTGLIPTHSHLFGAWVEHGLGGVAFWICVLALMGRVFVRFCNEQQHHLAPLVAYVLALFAWDIAFSPFGAERRVITALFLVTLSIYLREPKMGQDHSRSPRGPLAGGVEPSSRQAVA